MNQPLYDNTWLYISFQEYNPADPTTPGPATNWRVLWQWVVHQIEEVTNTEDIPSHISTSVWLSSTTTTTHDAYTITKTEKKIKAVTVFYVYSSDWFVKKALPEHIKILTYKYN